ncbi:iron utilization protein [Bordetella trematum]|uniref:siderophore-interacting protein n=1 Tax=Bordetella trematum TaxID=123899 RepID=UPI000795D4CC|nr:siderophore-interacting protein [Bordetella trematum]QIM71544.1 siderophore-interacting protein [Bordetella trematum]CZZ98245.1 iron utilization protein [Bordetella trematum]
MNTPDLRVERVRHPLKLRQLTVTRVEPLAGGLLARITVQGDDLQDFVTASFDDHVKIFFAPEPGQPVALPEIGPDGARFREDAPRPAARDYTPRLYDAGRRELVLDFVLHGDGPAGAWAAQAQPGQPLAIAGPRGSFVVPAAFDWHVLIGDETALPAIARRLEELPAGARALVVIEVPSAINQMPLTTRANASIRWLARDAGDPSLAEAAAALQLPQGEGYVWVAAESADAKAVRAVMVGQHKIDKSRIRASSYWKRGADGVHEALED